VDETLSNSQKPRKIGHYEIKSELGRGGMATVYLGYDDRFDRDVAVKVLPAEFLHDPQFSVRFHREARVIAALEHPAIVPGYDVGESDGLPYFVMRYMHGGSLADLLAKGEISLKEAARIFNIIAPALDDAHAKGIIHRDLKPANILFDHRNQPYLSDFGIAKISDSQVDVTGSAIIGTPAYISPEQAQGKEIDGRSDIYALGAILYRMLTGVRPYEGDTPMSMVVKHITDPVPDILKDRPDLPSGVGTFIYRAMAKDPDDRFQSAAEFADYLGALASGDKSVVIPTVVSRTKPSLKAPPPKKKSGWIFAFIALVGLAGIGFLINSVLPLSTPEPSLTPTVLVASRSTAKPIATATSSASITPVAVTETPTETPAPEGPPVLGGADKIAFLGNNNVWMMNIDGSELFQLTTDGSTKSKLQWLPDGKTLIFVVGKCVQAVDTEADRVDVVTCFEDAEYLEAFQISPSGKQIAVSLNRELFIVPLDLEKFTSTRNRTHLLEMGGCFYDDAPVRDVRWSSDETKLSVIFVDVAGNRQIDTIRVMDITRCASADPIRLDEFPAQRFTMSGYNSTSPFIPDFDWDGEDLFLMNTAKRNEGFGYFYTYNTNSHKALQLNPAASTCCYRDARWSPDGSYFIVAFQDIALGAEAEIELYYLLYGTLGTGATYTPLDLPEAFFTNRKEKPQFALRPTQ